MVRVISGIFFFLVVIFSSNCSKTSVNANSQKFVQSAESYFHDFSPEDGADVVLSWPNPSSIKEIEFLADGGMVIAGEVHRDEAHYSPVDIWVIKLAADYSVAWSQSFNDKNIRHLVDLNILIDGTILLLGAGQADTDDKKPDVWAVKLDKDGNKIFQKTYQGFGSSVPYASTPTLNGGFAFTGLTFKPEVRYSEVWVVSVGQSGEIIWQETISGSEGNDGGKAIKQLPSGTLIVAGVIETGSANLDVRVLSLDTLRNIIWDKTYGGDITDDVKAIELAHDGNLILAAEQLSKSEGRGFDTWVMKLDRQTGLSIESALIGKTFGYSNLVSALSKTSKGDFLVVSNSRSENVKESVLAIQVSSDLEVQSESILERSLLDGVNDLAITPDDYVFMVGHTESYNGVQSGWLRVIHLNK